MLDFQFLCTLKYIMYSEDYILNAVRLYKTRKLYNLSVINVLKILNIARSTLYCWIYTFSDKIYTSNNVTKISKQYKSKINEECVRHICDEVKTKKIINMKQICKNIESNFNITISKGHIYKILKENNITYKQIQKSKYNKSDEEFEQNKTDMKNKITNAKRNIISIDETSIELGMRMNKGWAEKGERCELKVTNKRKRYTLVLAINKTKVIGYKLVENGMNGEQYKNFVTEQLLIKNKATLLMDNARIHHYKKLKEIMEEKNRKIIYNIPYCPQFNPIEYVFNVMKKEIRQNSNIDTYNDLKKFINKFVKKMNISGFKNFFEKSYQNLFNDDKRNH